jgi:hypothetical protein
MEAPYYFVGRFGHRLALMSVVDSRRLGREAKASAARGGHLVGLGLAHPHARVGSIAG